MKIRENFGAANSKRCIFVLGSVPYDYDGHPKQASIFLFSKLENFDTCSVYVSFIFLINRIFVNIARNYKDEDIFNQPRRRWESSSFVSFLGCSDARSRRLERLCFLKINIYLKIIINQSGQDDQRNYVSCNVVISVMNRTLQVFNEWKQIIWVFSIPGILFPNASIVFKSPWWLTVFSFEIQDNML